MVMGWMTNMLAVMTTSELDELTDLEDHLLDVTGEYHNFMSLNDARQFAESIEYYMETEGYSAAVATNFTKRDMGLE